MKYYLAGPIDTAGKKEENLNAFREAANNLRHLGYDIISPIESNPPESCDSYDEFIRKDMKLLLDCGAIIMLPGWPQSKGARKELEIALHLNMRVYYFIRNTIRIVDMNF